MHVPVCIVGAGPAGLLLCRLLRVAGIRSLVLERRDRAAVEGRVRAGVLEAATVDLLREASVARRLEAEGLPHAGFGIVIDGERLRIDLEGLSGRHVTVYGQTEVTRDLIEAISADTPDAIVFGAESVLLHGLEGRAPRATWRHAGAVHGVTCDFVAGCDGFHGVARASIPESALWCLERRYPFAWLGILSEVPPCDHELIYARHERGFALASMRSATRSRYYVQVPADADLADWPDARIWDELAIRLGPDAAARMTRGVSFEKSLTPLRSFVCERMRQGRLFLAGDAAHIVPPCGAKGLNLAASDVALLSSALIAYYRRDDPSELDLYEARALARVWDAERFSWWFTTLMHVFPDDDAFDRRLQRAEWEQLRASRAAREVLARSYVGPPLRSALPSSVREPAPASPGAVRCFRTEF